MAGGEEQQEASGPDARETERQVERMLASALEPDARARLSNLRMANRTLYLRAAQTVGYLAQNRGFARRITDAELKQVLQGMSSQKRETTIRRK